MGEELYGEPELCLREIIQNALDATHLRWLRYELRRRMTEKLGEAVYLNYDLPPADASLSKNDLEIKVSWGVDNLPDDGWRRDDEEPVPDERHWIEIEDPGTGMTLDVVRNYFTQIGRSYYQSPEYRRDRALFREYDLPASEISQFGIGILSCFMLADLVEVWTCPIPSNQPGNADNQAHHFRIWGADGLFWHQPTNEKNTPGTRIRMWLKKDRQASCQEENLQTDLFAVYYGSNADRSRVNKPVDIDPLRTIWLYIQWPRYPIVFQPQDFQSPFKHWRLSETASLSRLLPLDRQNWAGRYEQLMDQPSDASLTLHWAWWDWEHSNTASRIRIALPVTRNTDAGAASDLSTLLKRMNSRELSHTIPTGIGIPFVADAAITNEGRTRVLIRGDWISWIPGIHEYRRFAASAGAVVVIDLSGHVAPRLRADRKATTQRQRGDWPLELGNVFEAWMNEASQSIKGNSELSRIAATSISLYDKTWYELADARARPASTVLLTQSQSSIRSIWKLYLELDLNHGRDFERATDHHNRFGISTAIALNDHVDFTLPQTRDPALSVALAIALNDDLDINWDGLPRFDIDYVLDLNLIFDSPHMTQLVAWASNRDSIIGIAFSRMLGDLTLPEIFGDSLLSALPAIQAPIAAGRGSAGRMISPFQIDFQIEAVEEGHQLPVAIPRNLGWAAPPEWLEKLQYDIVVPWTQIPIGNLRQRSSAWQTERACRATSVLPFAFSSALNWRRYRSDLNGHCRKLQLSQVVDILLLIPEESLDMLPFKEWKKAKTKDHVVTAYWKLDEDRVLWAEGFHDRRSIVEHGRTLEDHAGINTD
jgi:hypothetical protein